MVATNFFKFFPSVLEKIAKKKPDDGLFFPQEINFYLLRFGILLNKTLTNACDAQPSAVDSARFYSSLCLLLHIVFSFSSFSQFLNLCLPYHQLHLQKGRVTNGI